jgi:UDP-N-acetylglucosamine diphosphorylase / glucose-1-phosphate thymidylyltransferase / UDP-N-acetylgalactosamine diphosphorylase / glucosamine-1-phosphate N-acetyltransferase / galactosamine-1-phosphate N-acetyltransferase
MLKISDYISCWPGTGFARYAGESPWALTSASRRVVSELITTLSHHDYQVEGDVALHRTAVIESGAVLKGPLVVGPECFIAAGAYLRDGTWLARECTLGPGVELKSCFVFSGAKIAHFNFIGDSLIGERVNFEAGSIVCNYRNERRDGAVYVLTNRSRLKIDVAKFGAVVGDDCRVGANAVLAPGTLVEAGAVIERGALVDQDR